MSSGGGCPYKPKAKQQEKSLPQSENLRQSQTNSKSGGCPYKPVKKSPPTSKQKVYNVYSQEIDPDNNMPANPNQLPRQDQSEPLSTDRVKSTIPKGGTEDVWTYPSPQMFFNALKRKGKGEDVRENDMQNVVAVHNSMNEQTWNQILKWEKVRSTDYVDSEPSLLRFLGRPDDISPRAWFLSTFSSKPAPFDRHDWTVLRGEEEVRYVIDYYYMDDGIGGNTTLPTTATGAFDKGAADSKLIFVDARPALDSWSSVISRIKVALGLESISDPWVDDDVTDSMRKQSSNPDKNNNDNIKRNENHHASDENSHANRKPLSHSLEVDPSSTDERFRPEALEKMSQWIEESCASKYARMEQACRLSQQAVEEGRAHEGSVSDECQVASIAVQVCVAQLVCKSEATDFLNMYSKGSDAVDEVNQKFESMTSCVDKFAARAAAVQSHQQRQPKRQTNNMES